MISKKILGIFLLGFACCGWLFGNSAGIDLKQFNTNKREIPSVLFLKGSPYELGYQHGEKLKEAIAYNVKRLIDDGILAYPEHPQVKSFLAVLPRILEHVPEEYKQELKGLAEGANVPLEKIVLLNLFPEMFHCSGVIVKGKATKNEEIYHVRVLDYAAGKNLQDTAVLMVVKPEGKIPFLNVSYAGFIGSVTGMNAQQIALGEIGGKGYGQYDGMPMAFLLRSILERAKNLQDVKELLASTPRTCEYYYLFSDGKDRQSLGVYTTGQQLQLIEPGTSYAIFDSEFPQKDVFNPEDKIVFNPSQIESSSYQTVLYRDYQRQHLWGLIHHQPTDCLLLTGFCYAQRYPILVQRILEKYGTIDEQALQDIVKAPVARPTNLHNAIFAPTTLDVWIAHAGIKGEPAYDQPYYHFNLIELLQENESGSQ